MQHADKKKTNGAARPGLLFALLIMLWLPAVGQAQYSFETTVVDDSGDVGKRSSIAINPSNNHVHIAYFDDTTHELKHAYLDETGDWTVAVIDASPSDSANAVDIHVDSTGTVHFAYSDISANALKYAEWNDPANLNIQTVDTGTYPFALSVSLDTDRQGRPYIAYSANSALRLAYVSGNANDPADWTIVNFVRDDGIGIWTLGGHPLAVEHSSYFADPVVHIVAQDVRLREMRRLAFPVSTGLWSEETIATFTATDRVHSISSTWRDGTLQVSYIIGTIFTEPPPHPPSRLYYSSDFGGAWSSPENVDLSDPAFPENIYFSAVIETNSAGTPFILLRGGSVTSPWYATRSGSGWSGDRIHESDWDPYGEDYLSLAVDSCSNLHISFYDSLRDDLVYSRGEPDSNPDSCAPQGDPVSGGSGSSSKSSCKAVFTSWTEMPRLICDNMFQILAILKYRNMNDICPTSAPCYFGHRQGAGGRFGKANHEAIYSAAADVFSPLFGEPVPRRALSRMRDILSGVQPGRYFSDEHKRALLNTLADRRQPTPETLVALTNGLNAIELDRSVPELRSMETPQGSYTVVEFDGVAWVSFRGLDRSGKATLRIVNDVTRQPAIDGFAPGWPAARYQFDFTGELQPDGYMDVNLNLAGLNYEDYRGMRLFELNGNVYRDITTYVDKRRKIISGRTTQLTSYVVMVPVRD